MTTADRATRGLLPTWRTPASLRGQAARFAVVGLVSTVAYVVLYAALRNVAPSTIANTLALLITAVGNTAANRRLTFGFRGRESLVRDHAGGLARLAIALLVTTLSVSALDRAVPAAGRIAELAVLTAANALATAMRFLFLRAWMTGARSTSPSAGPSVRPPITELERTVP
ncbi:MAG TPA: GtrA family protein [Candidatus Acidoferrum sp.]|nr:GtrA family protein [Candidatus Acidoferrum sp.]